MTMAKKANAKKDKRHVCLERVRLSKESKKALKKYKVNFNEPVVEAIEFSSWNIPSETYEFIDIKTSFENSLHDFFKIPKDVLIEVDSFETGILSFEKKVYPKYH